MIEKIIRKSLSFILETIAKLIGVGKVTTIDIIIPMKNKNKFCFWLNCYSTIIPDSTKNHCYYPPITHDDHIVHHHHDHYRQQSSPNKYNLAYPPLAHGSTCCCSM